jgi:hypothetical protein
LRVQAFAAQTHSRAILSADGCFVGADAAAGIVDDLQRIFARFTLRAHLPNLGHLFSKLSYESFYLFLSLGDVASISTLERF